MHSMIRFGIVGCGRISEKHIQAIKANPEAELVAVCDINGKQLEKAHDAAFPPGEFINALGNKNTYGIYSDMLQNPDIDVIDICTPNYLHEEMCIAAAAAGKHVLVEKPMALCTYDAEGMIAACKEANVKLFVVKQNRFNPPIRLLKKAIDNRRFGKIVFAEARVLWSRPQEYYDKSEWHGKLAKDGGMLFTQASHHIDMLQWLLGPVEEIKGFSGTMTHEIETEDLAAISLKFQSGALGSLVATTCTFPHNIEGSIAILGENGTVIIGGTAMNRIDVWEFKDYCNEDDLIKQMNSSSVDIYGQGHKAVIKEVTDCLLHGKEPLVSGEEGLKSVEIIERFYGNQRDGESRD